MPDSFVSELVQFCFEVTDFKSDTDWQAQFVLKSFEALCRLLKHSVGFDFEIINHICGELDRYFRRCLKFT